MSAIAKRTIESAADGASIIIFGRDGKKSRGSWFPPDEKSAAKSAAKMMGMNCLVIANDDTRQLATKLPKGRLFESGKAFVPFVQSAVVDALVTHLPEGEQLQVRMVGSASAADKSGGGAESGNTKAPPVHRPTDWDDIKIGSIVLASESDEDGWWPCIVTEAYPKELRLKWQTFDGYPPFTRSYEQVALLWAPQASTATA